MWHDRNKPASDPAQGQRFLVACISTSLLIALLLEKPARFSLKDLEEFSEVVLLRSQISEIECELCTHPKALNEFRRLLRHDFSIVDTSGVRAAEIYQLWVDEARSMLHRPNLKWCFLELFQKLDLSSRLFLARVRLTKAQVLLTDDSVARHFARMVDLTA